jgi:hypothetical protein
MLLHNLDQEG